MTFTDKEFRLLIERHLVSTMARHTASATPRDWWVATALAVRDQIHGRMIDTQAVHNEKNARRIYYFSLEYLIGRLFESNLLATGLTETARGALKLLGVDFDQHIQFVIDALKPYAEELGIGGKR